MKFQKHTLLYLAISIYILSILFKIMHWPYTTVLQMLSLIIGVSWIYNYFKNKNND